MCVLGGVKRQAGGEERRRPNKSSREQTVLVDGLDWKVVFFIGGGNGDGETINVALTTSRLDIF